MKEYERFERAFREKVLLAVNTGLYDPKFPQSSFINIFIGFVKKLGKPQSLEEHDERHKYFARLFIDALEKIRAKINMESEFIQTYSSGKKSLWITEEMRRGAEEADFRHHQVLGKDY